MLLVFTIVALVSGWLAGARPPALALLAAGFALQAVLAARMVRSTLDAAGGHAEWVRVMGTRPRLERDPLWGVGVALTLAGVVVALWP